ncbi:T9SS type A sorting domain-containing protein [Hymenobacter terricola]|uniref:T9SS type A sorting domain-containing protein n=1 Tax=Hymenobacter terricola TaxID=2819236 RepID=UPI001B30C515|nr:T9SS type A sorting domain-containing protein [Hymenobacter terricola]
MKKSLLFLGLLGLACNAHAQTPWTLVNSPTTNVFGAYSVTDINTMTANSAWILTTETPPTGSTTATIPGTYMVTNNAAGDQFNFGGITVTGNATVGNIAGTSNLIAVAAAYPGATYSGATTYGGEIVKTIDGGNSWTNKTVGKFVSGFCNWVYMFNATTGVSLGDPTGGAFEMLRTTDGGENWTRLTSGVPAPLNAQEYGNAGSFFGSKSAPGTMWTGLASANGAAQVRVLKTTDFGVTWTASALIPNIVGAVSQLAFKSNNLDGIAYGYTVVAGAITALNVARTADGGATWTAITPASSPTGNFFRYGIDAVNGLYYSVGARYPLTTPTALATDYGSSYSSDGVTWTNMTTYSNTVATNPGYFFALDLIQGATANSTVGYGGLLTDANGVGGVFKFSRTITSTRDAALQSALNVYPNPSASGVFKVDLGSTVKAGSKLTVVDALGRQVAAQTLSATAIGSQTINLDLSAEKTGIYTLQVRSDAGIATQKIVID